MDEPDADRISRRALLWSGVATSGVVAAASPLAAYGSSASASPQSSTTLVNVKDHGAVGDGSTDDTAAIQAALDAVTVGVGGEVFFPPGNYFVPAGGLVPRPNTRVTGIGRVASYGSQITLGSSASLPLFACSGVHGLQFDGLDLTAQSSWGGTAIDGSSGDVNYLFVRDCWFAGFYLGINLSSATPTYHVWILNNYFDAIRNSNGAAGIAMRAIQSPTVVQNFIQGTAINNTLNSGILIPSGGGSCQYAVLANNNIGQIGSGIYISDTGISDATIMANQITGCGTYGMYLHNLTGCVILGNTVTDVSLAGTYHAYEISAGHGGSVVIGNLYENEFSSANADFGFYLNTSVPLVFKGNRVASGSTTSGPGSINTGSILYDPPSKITVESSPFMYRNSDISDEVVWIVGGKVLSVVFTRNNINVTLPTSGPVYLGLADSVTVTYSEAPTMTKVPL